MNQIQAIKYLLFIFIAITMLPGIGIILCYGFPKVKNADEIHVLLPPKEWTPEKFKQYKRLDLISRLRVTLLLTGTVTLVILAFFDAFA